MFYIIWIASIIISYIFYRYNFMHMDIITKETAPIPLIIFILFIPIINLIFGVIMYLLFVRNSDNGECINKFFNIKS